MPDNIDEYSDDDMMAQEERDGFFPAVFVDKVNQTLKPFGGRLAVTGLPSMGERSERLLVWIADVPRERRRGALLALEEVGLWDRKGGFRSMSATNPAELFEEFGSLMEEQVNSLVDARYRVTFRRDDEDEDLKCLVAGQFSVWHDVAGSRLLRVTLTLDGRLDVQLGQPNYDAPVRRYRASETDYLWQDDRHGDAGPFTSRELADDCGQALRELLSSLNRPTGHLHEG